MLNSYTYYRILRIGFIPEIPKSQKIRDYVEALGVTCGDIQYLISDGGLCEDECDDSEIVFLALSLYGIIRHGYHAKVKEVKRKLEETYGEELSVMLPMHDENLIVDFITDGKSLPVASYYLGLHDQTLIDVYSRVNPSNKKGINPDKAEYQTPFVELYSRKFKDLDFSDIGVKSKFM